MSQGPRIVIVAEHASVRFGGEASLPYHYFRVLRARGADAFLITHERTRAELEALFPQDLDRLRFVRDRVAQKLFYRLSLRLPRRVADSTLGLVNQWLTQRAACDLVRALVCAGDTVVLQPIPVSPKFPSAIADVGAPVVIGPMNGGMEYPRAFRAAEPVWVRMLIAAGRASSGWAQRLFPGKRKASLLLVANERTWRALPPGSCTNVREIVENGVDLAQWPLPSSPPHGQRFLFLGRLVDWKALDIVLEAMAEVGDAQLDVVGDGPMRAAWEGLAARLGLGDRVRFLGWQDQARCAALLAAARALVLPSLYECGGAVVLEAMACAPACGRPKCDPSATRFRD